MIKVGIAGTLSAVNRHSNALSRINDICITGILPVNGSAHEEFSQRTCEEFITRNDALIITDSSSFLTELAVSALKKARHVFLYPHNEVYQLIKLAREANVILKCGRTGRSGINGLINVVPDMNEISMLEFRHVLKISTKKINPLLSEIVPGDIEIISSLVKARNTSLKAKGLAFFECNPDIISARLEFDNGSVASYYCNTLGLHEEHNISLILRDGLLEYDLKQNTLTGWYRKRADNQNENPIFIENIKVGQTDHLFEDLNSFVKLIHSGPAFLSIYDNGFESFILTDRILEKVSKTLVQFA